MDLLADIFKSANLRRRLLRQHGIGPKMALKFPCNKSLGFHLVTQGEAYLHVDGKKKPLKLKKGDIALMARGVDHFLSSEEILPKHHLELAENRDSGVSAKLAVISGAYQFWNDPVHPLFSELPSWYVLEGQDIQSFDPLQVTMNLLSLELSKPDIGSETIVQSLLDVIFSHIIRQILLRQETKPATWSYALRSESIRQAIELMHAEYAQDWTIEDLAKRVGLSRAGFSQKFKIALGETPMHYLTTVRVQKAMELLSNTSDKIEVVAEAVGFKDAFIFSKVFKRVAGQPPREFRRRNEAEKSIPWRF